MHTTHQIAAALGLAAICAVGLTAQTQETKTTTETKVEIKGGKDITTIGCLERRPNGNYVLAETRESRRIEYALVTKDDLSKQVGQRVEVVGKAVADGAGTVSIESKTKTEVEHGKDQEMKTKTEATSGTLETPFIGVSSVKTLSMSCN